MTNDIENRLEAIYNALDIYRKNINSGLFGGTLGEFVFISEYNKTNLKISDSNLTYDILSKVLDYYDNNGLFSYNLNFGITGLGFIINYLYKNNQCEDYLSSLNEEIVEIIKPFYLNNYKNIDLDYMNGIPGILIYLIENNLFEMIELYIDNLIEENYLENTGGKWSIESLLNENSKNINVGLSHGIICHLYIFRKIYEKGFMKEKMLTLINKLYIFLLKIKVEPIFNDESYFGSIFQKDGHKINSRLAWCYGDLSIGFLLLKVAISINNFEIQKLALDILLFSTKRKTFDNTKILDAGFCHGSSGVAYIYKKIYDLTCMVQFNECYKFWINFTINNFNFEDGIGGYKFYIPDKDQKFSWVNNLSLLEGACGVGLVLLNYKFNDISHWDQMLMLD
ncbi:lanthionine synthetase LanC family protein [Spirosoma lituiforme]